MNKDKTPRQLLNALEVQHKEIDALPMFQRPASYIKLIPHILGLLRALVKFTERKT